MNLKSSNKVRPSYYELEIEIEKEEVQKAIDKVYLRQRKHISVPGFRKGKVPKSYIEKYYGEKVFLEDAIELIYPDTVKKAVEEAGLEVIDDEVDFEIITAEKDGVVFKVGLTTKPEVEIADYKGIEIKAMSVDVDDDEIEKEIEAARKRNARLINIEDRPVKDGDTVIIDFKGYIDDVPFNGGEAKNHKLKIGSHQFINGFEEQIVGHNTNDEFDVNVTFPEDYYSKKLAGKAAKFEVILHEIKEEKLPNIDDEFVKDVSEFDTLDEYKNDIRKQLQEKKQSDAQIDSERKIIDKLVELIKADIPEVMFKRRLDYDLNNFEQSIKAQGLTFEKYEEFSGQSKEMIKNNLKPTVERTVKSALALEKIAELEGIIPDETEINEKYDQLAKEYKMDVEKVKKLILEKDVVRDIQILKALEFVKDNAVIVD